MRDMNRSQWFAVFAFVLSACGGKAAGPGSGAAGSSGVAGTTGAAGTTGVAGTTGAAGATPTPSTCRRPFFPPSAPWNQRADGMAVDAQSGAIIGALQAHGWGAGHMQIDTSIHVMCDAAGSAP